VHRRSRSARPTSIGAACSAGDELPAVVGGEQPVDLDPVALVGEVLVGRRLAERGEHDSGELVDLAGVDGSQPDPHGARV